MDTVKNMITEESALARFDPAKQVVLITDASNTGLGYVLLQTDSHPEAGEPEDDHLTRHTVKKMPTGKLICCGSRFLS